MWIYDVDARLTQLLENVDDETGELLCSIEDIEALQMERDRLLEDLALSYKNYTAEAAAIRAEEKALAERRKKRETRAKNAKKTLETVLKGEAFKTARVAVSYRRSEAVEIFDPDEFFAWAATHQEFIRSKPEVDKTAIKEAIDGGMEIPGAEIAVHNNMSVK